MSSRAPHNSNARSSPSSRLSSLTGSTHHSSTEEATNAHTQKRGLKRPRGFGASTTQNQNARMRPVGTPPRQPNQTPSDDVTYDVTALSPDIVPAPAPPRLPLPPGTPVFARMDPTDPKWYPARISLLHHTDSPGDAPTGHTYTVNWEPLDSLTFSDDIPHCQVRAMVDPIIQPDDRNTLMSARPTASMNVMHAHQEQIHMASQSSRHNTQSLRLADMIISALHRSNPSNTAYPYQQDEVFNAVKHVSKTIHHINKHIGSSRMNQNSSQLPSGRQQIWHAVMTAKYTNMTSPDKRSIAHGVYIPREGGQKSVMSLNNDPAAELQWLSHFSTDTTSPFHNPHVSRFWSRAQQCGFDGTSRTPVLRRTPAEIVHISRQHNNHSTPTDRKQCIANTKAIIASLQSSGHLVTSPLPSYAHDIERARALGFTIGALTEAQLIADWQYHDRTVFNTTPPTDVRQSCTSWSSRLLVMLENPSRSTLFRNKRRKRQSPTQSSIKHWGLHHVTRGAAHAHCSGGTTWLKEAYLASNWGLPLHMCNGDSPHHNCGCSRNHKISPAGKHDTDNCPPSSTREFRKGWTHYIPNNLYMNTLSMTGALDLPSLFGYCAIHIGSGTGSMKRALQATGIFVIGIDRYKIISTGTREEHTTYIADYDTCQGDIETLIMDALHTFGFQPHQVLLISFDADCATRSIMTINMNKKCRDATTGHADVRKPGGQEALLRDNIDMKIMRWIDSISESHTDHEIVARATRWPPGPGGWGYSHEDTSVLLTSHPRWDPRNHTITAVQRRKRRMAFRKAFPLGYLS